jgi:hypothetical protein
MGQCRLKSSPGGHANVPHQRRRAAVGLDTSRPGRCCPVAVQRVAGPSAVRGELWQQYQELRSRNIGPVCLPDTEDPRGPKAK